MQRSRRAQRHHGHRHFLCSALSGPRRRPGGPRGAVLAPRRQVRPRPGSLPRVLTTVPEPGPPPVSTACCVLLLGARQGFLLKHEPSSCPRTCGSVPGFHLSLELFSGVQSTQGAYPPGQAVGPEGHAGLSSQVCGARDQLWEPAQPLEPCRASEDGQGTALHTAGTAELGARSRGRECIQHRADRGPGGWAHRSRVRRRDQLMTSYFSQKRAESQSPCCVRLRVTGGEATRGQSSTHRARCRAKKAFP